MKQMNYLGLLSFLSLLAILGWVTENKGFYGFLGFLAYVQYFWVIPDELFLQNVQKSCTIAFFAEMISLIPLMFFCIMFEDIPAAFGLSFGIGIFVFSIALAVLEWRDQRGAAE